MIREVFLLFKILKKTLNCYMQLVHLTSIKIVSYQYDTPSVGNRIASTNASFFHVQKLYYGVQKKNQSMDCMPLSSEACVLHRSREKQVWLKVLFWQGDREQGCIP